LIGDFFFMFLSSFNPHIGFMRLYMITSVWILLSPWFSCKFFLCQTRMFLFFCYSRNNSCLLFTFLKSFFF
jgi:hypothetical protein